MRVFRLLTLFALICLTLISGQVLQRAMAISEDEVLHLEPATPTKPVSLRDMLIVGLEARLKSEIAFVDLVVAEVQAGHLPQRLVDQTFFWARQRSLIVRHGQYNRPIIYFRPAMRARANQIHVTL